MSEINATNQLIHKRAVTKPIETIREVNSWRAAKIDATTLPTCDVLAVIKVLVFREIWTLYGWFKVLLYVSQLRSLPIRAAIKLLSQRFNKRMEDEKKAPNPKRIVAGSNKPCGLSIEKYDAEFWTIGISQILWGSVNIPMNGRTTASEKTSETPLKIITMDNKAICVFLFLL